MSKSIISKFFILLLVVGLLFAVAPTKQAQAATLDVCPSCTYTTINAALTAAVAGDTINVAAGTYTENLVINKSVTLTGAGRDVTTITAANPVNDTIDVAAAGVTISGFKVTGATGQYADGIYLMGTANSCTIRDNEISGNAQNGISIVSSNNTVEHNIIANNSYHTVNKNGAGVALFDYGGYVATGNIIQFNTITGNLGFGGVGSTSTGTNNISKNWWGSATGPTNTYNPGGTGDVLWTNQAISLLTYSPWLGMAPQYEYNGNVNGVFTTSETGAVTGNLTGTYTLNVTGQVSAYTENSATFSGTVTGDIIGDITASINAMGVDTLAGTITGTGASLPVRILGFFPQSGTTGDFVGQIITGTVPPLATSMAITTPGDVSTVFTGQTLQMGVNIDPVTAAYGQWSLYAPTTGTTISETGLLTAGAPGTFTVIVKALDGSLLDATKSITIVAPDTKLLMDPATFETTDTCTGTREVFVKVKDVTNMASYQLYLEYDAELITVTDVVNVGDIAGTAAPDNSFANGVISFGWYPPSGGGDPTTYTGDFSLIKITFTSKGLAGTGAFTILPTSFLNDWPEVQDIPYEITGGASVSFGSIVTNTTKAPQVSYCDLAFAVGEAEPNDTLRADANITSNVSITIDKALTLNTNGKTISRTVAPTPNNSFSVVPGGNLTITGGGTITANSGTAIRIVGNATTLAKVTLVDATLYAPSFSVAILGNRTYDTHDTPYLSQFVMTGGNTNETVILEGNGAEADITGGTLTGYAPIMGNGTVDPVQNKNEGGTKITIGGLAVIDGRTGTPSIAVFHPQDGLLTINGGTIIGTNGIEMDAGDLVITGGTIQATGACLAAPVETPEDGSTDTGDAILILHQNGYSAGDMMNVTISGSPTIISDNCYALRELDFGGASSELALATISGGHFTGGASGAVYFATNNATNLELTDGDYSSDPIAYVYTPYFTYKSGSRWYIAIPPSITSDNIQGYYLVDGLVDDGREFSVSLMNPLTGDAYTDVMFKITIPNASLTDLNNIDFYEEGWGPDGYPKWYDMHFAQVGSDLVGWYGGIFYGGFPLPADGVARPGTLRVDFATPGTYTVNLELFTVTGIDSYADYFDYKEEVISLLATKTFTMNVYDAPTVSVVTDPYFIVNEAGNFSVTVANPTTGRNYGNNVVFDLVIPGHLPADFGAMSCSFGATTWPVTLLPDGLGGSYTRIGGLDGFFDITAPFGPMTINCTVTYLAAGTYNVTGKMTDTLATTDLTDDRVIQTGVGAVVAYTKPTIVPTFPTDPIFAGVPVSVPVEIINPSQLADPFDLVITVPAGTVITATGYTVTCVGTTCTITVDLTDPAVYPVTLPLVFTFPAAVTPDISFNLYDLDWIGTDDRLLATFTEEDLAIGSGYTVSGTITMQGRPGVLNGIPVTLYWDSTFATYGPSMETDTSPVNFHLAVTYGGTYKFTTLQPRFLNITKEMLKAFNVTGNKTLESLWMRAGNAVWKGVNADDSWNGLYDNAINGADSSLVGTMYGSDGAPNIAGNSGDVNFDNIVNIKDLTLVGGNMGLTSATAYADSIWMP